MRSLYAMDTFNVNFACHVVADCSSWMHCCILYNIMLELSVHVYAMLTECESPIVLYKRSGFGLGLN